MLVDAPRMPPEELQEPEPRAPRSPYAVAPSAELLYSLRADGSRRWIDPVLTRGRFWRLRLGLAVALIALFVGLPHLRVAGKPGLFIDVAQRQFTVAGVTLHPTDNLLLLALGATLIVGLFALTALLGRLWCGYACPQPVYLEFVYRPLERLAEGRPAARRARDTGPWTLQRLGRKAAKWSLFLVVSALLSATFVSYFVGWGPLWQGLLHAPLQHRGELIAVGLVSGLMLLDFGFFRDQMCSVACPYGRLQNVLYDPDTLIVGYDSRRGEPRQARRRGVETPGAGDCVACERCVRTCPTGVDIRRGLQLECIGCAQCIEACDEVMQKQGMPPGLIRYTTLRELTTGQRRFARPRVLVYGCLMGVALGALVYLATTRSPFDVEILRSGREAFRMLPGGEVANLLRLRLTNRRDLAQDFVVELLQPAGAALVVSQSPFRVEARRVGTLDVVVRLPEQAFARGQAASELVVRGADGATKVEPFVLLGPFR